MEDSSQVKNLLDSGHFCLAVGVSKIHYFHVFWLSIYIPIDDQNTVSAFVEQGVIAHCK